MIRSAIFPILLAVLMWAPWMDSKQAELTEQVFAAFGPVPSTCYDSEGELLQDGIEIRWYPMGRLVHTCSGDYVVFAWNGIKELGGVYKTTEELQSVQSKALTCREVLERQEARRATSTDSEVVLYEGEATSTLDFSMFPEAEAWKTLMRQALLRGPTFAGRFAVAEWECGSGCQNYAVMDVESGLVIAHGSQTEFGIEYSLESTLLITNPVSGLPELPESEYETENVALSIARVPREYYRLTTDALSGTQYLVRMCVENSATGYIEVEDERLGVIESDGVLF